MLYPRERPVFKFIHVINCDMKKKDIPQQPHRLYEGETKAVYALNDKGELEMAQTSGWEVETDVLQQAIDEIQRLTDEALKRVCSGESSPLEYHMYAQRMDLPMLAQAVGRFKWQVRKHLKPKYFRKLKQQQLNLYAKVLGIDTAALQKIPDEH